MKYNITNKYNKYYLPAIELWILKDLCLTLREAYIYKMALQKGFLVWNSEYIGDIIQCSGKSVLRSIQSLEDKQVIAKRNIVVGGKLRSVIVALYTVDGIRSDKEIQDLLHQGVVKLQKNNS